MKRMTMKERFCETRGLATVETALVLMFLMIVTFGIMEYGWMFHRIQQIDNCARAGARQAVLPDSTLADAQTAVNTLAGNFSIAGYSTTVSPADPTALDSGELITVTFAVPYDNVRLLGLSLFPLPTTLRGSVTMAKEGP